jgi:hypothetical protein
MDKLTNSSALILPTPSTNMATTNAVVEDDIRGIKDPVPIPNTWLWLAWVLAAAALIALAWYTWKRWKRRPKKSAAEVFVPPHERARRKLQEALNLLDQPKPFCTVVSDAVRLYLEERFSLRAPERTTEEFLTELQTTQHLTRQQKDSLADFLSRCDLVKFAKFEPPVTALQDIYQAALRLIEETEPKPETAAGPVEVGRTSVSA